MGCRSPQHLANTNFAGTLFSGKSRQTRQTQTGQYNGDNCRPRKNMPLALFSSVFGIDIIVNKKVFKRPRRDKMRPGLFNKSHRLPNTVGFNLEMQVLQIRTRRRQNHRTQRLSQRTHVKISHHANNLRGSLPNHQRMPQGIRPTESLCSSLIYHHLHRARILCHLLRISLRKTSTREHRNIVTREKIFIRPKNAHINFSVRHFNIRRKTPARPTVSGQIQTRTRCDNIGMLEKSLFDRVILTI